MASIKKELISGVLYTTISKYSGIIISGCRRNISTLNCPRRIWYSSNSNCNYFFGIFSDLGIAPAIIQK